MNDLKNPRLSANAQSLRRNMTPEERHLWYDYLRGLPLMVHRQKVLGPYIVDFYVAAARMVIEVDGVQHYEDRGRTRDQARDAWLRAQGLTVLRYTNQEVKYNFYGVCADIDRALQTALNGAPQQNLPN